MRSRGGSADRIGHFPQHQAVRRRHLTGELAVALLQDAPHVAGVELAHAHFHQRADVSRLVTMWSELLAAHKGPMLFGAFSIADAYFAPVCMRLKTYALPVPAEISAYVERVRALPGVKAWIDDALAEKDFLDFEEPYRLKR